MAFLREKGVTISELGSYNGPFSSRPVVEVLLLEKALLAGGLDAELSLIAAPNVARGLKDIQSGRAVMFGSEMWENHAGDDFYSAEPLIPAGAFAKLFYFRDPKVAASIRNLDDLQKYKGITVEDWQEDRKVLDGLGLTYITAPNWELMWKMLGHGRCDYIFIEPNSEPGPMVLQGQRVYPVKELKASFPHGRSFLVYKKNPMGREVYEHLQKGLAVLKENGELEKALIQSGILHQRIMDWRDLTSEQREKK